MAGNALDRAEAKQYIDKAELGLDTVCEKLQTVGAKVNALNYQYQGASSSSLISHVYASFYNLIIDCMDSFGSASEHVFIDYHKGLVALINAGADGDEISPAINSHDRVISRELHVNPSKAGIKDYATAKGCVDDLQEAVNKFVSSTDELINAYQKLWWLADGTGNIAIQEKAHEAADKVRDLVSYYGSKFLDINTKFKETIEENEEQQQLSAAELEERANTLYNTLNQIDFRTITENQDAAKEIADNWRNSL